MGLLPLAPFQASQKTYQFPIKPNVVKAADHMGQGVTDHADLVKMVGRNTAQKASPDHALGRHDAVIGNRMHKPVAHQKKTTGHQPEIDEVDTLRSRK